MKTTINLNKIRNLGNGAKIGGVDIQPFDSIEEARAAAKDFLADHDCHDVQIVRVNDDLDSPRYCQIEEVIEDVERDISVVEELQSIADGLARNSEDIHDFSVVDNEDGTISVEVTCWRGHLVGENDLAPLKSAAERHGFIWNYDGSGDDEVGPIQIYTMVPDHCTFKVVDFKNYPANVQLVIEDDAGDRAVVDVSTDIRFDSDEESTQYAVESLIDLDVNYVRGKGGEAVRWIAGIVNSTNY